MQPRIKEAPVRSTIRGVAAVIMSVLLLTSGGCSDDDAERIKANQKIDDPVSDGGSGP